MSDRSRIPGFYRLPMPVRHARLAERFGLDGDELAALSPEGGLALTRADKMVENCVGTFSLPIGLGLNFRINGRDYAVPMVVEEPSVVAAASNAARSGVATNLPVAAFTSAPASSSITTAPKCPRSTA